MEFTTDVLSVFDKKWALLTAGDKEKFNTMTVLGSKSGRDMDKMQGSGLTAKEAGRSMTFEEAEVTLVCRKLFRQELKAENMLPEIANTFYSGSVRPAVNS